MLWTILSSSVTQLGLFSLGVTIATEGGPTVCFLPFGKTSADHGAQAGRRVWFGSTSGENSMFVTSSLCMFIVLWHFPFASLKTKFRTHARTSEIRQFLAAMPSSMNTISRYFN
jgi:hypothetical protein